MRPQRAAKTSPGSSVSSPSPVLNASGAQVIGSGVMPCRRRSGSGTASHV
jgi:hypothetical protein